MMRHARARCDDGFTMVELVATIVILGLIAVPLATVLTQSLEFLPSASGETAASTRESLVVNQIADDLTNSIACPGPATRLPCGAGAGSGVGAVVTSITCAESAASKLYLFYTTHDANVTAGSAPAPTWYVWYHVTLDPLPARPTMRLVTLSREAWTTSTLPPSSGGGSPQSTTSYSLGYCDTGSTNPIVTVDNDNTAIGSSGWVHVNLAVMPTPDDVVRSIDFGATPGCTIGDKYPGCSTAAPTDSD